MKAGSVLTGHQAEALVAEHLKSQDYKILDTNWRSKRCEIDIVASKNKIIYFIEVKYRNSTNQGSGFDYLTPAKLKQVEFSAKVWTAHNNFSGDYRILAAEVDAYQNIMLEELVI